MSRFVKMLAISIVVVGLLMMGHSMMSPLPISAATTALGGLAAFWLFRSRPTAALGAGGGIGAAIGAGIHAFSHLFVGHTHPHVHDAVAAHIVGDVTVGILVGFAVLALPMLTAGYAERSSTN